MLSNDRLQPFLERSRIVMAILQLFVKSVEEHQYRRMADVIVERARSARICNLIFISTEMPTHNFYAFTNGA